MKALESLFFFLCCIVFWYPSAQQLFLDFLQPPEMLQQVQMLGSFLIFHQKLLKAINTILPFSSKHRMVNPRV